MANFKLYKKLKKGGYLYITSWDCETKNDAIEHFKDTKCDLEFFNKHYHVTAEFFKDIKSSKKQGGSRLNSGAKPKYNEPTTTIAFRVPKSKVNELKELVKYKLESYYHEEAIHKPRK